MLKGLEEALKKYEDDKNFDIVKYFQNHYDRDVNEAVTSILFDGLTLENAMTETDRQFCKEKREREIFNNLRTTMTKIKREWYNNQKKTLLEDLQKAYNAGDKEKAAE